MYCTVAVVVDTFHSSLLKHERTGQFFIVLLQFWFAWSTSFILWISRTLTAWKPWWCYTSNCYNKRCACSNKRRIYEKKIWSFFLSRNCSNKRFAP